MIVSDGAEWGAAGAIAVVVGKAGWDLILRLLDRKPSSSSSEPAPMVGLNAEEREAFRRMEECIRDVRDRVVRLDDLHAARRPDGLPAVYCDSSRLEPQLREIHAMMGRVLDEERQSRGLLARMARRLQLSTRAQPREEDPK